MPDTHEDQVDMIIEELSNVRWGFRFDIFDNHNPPGIDHLVKIEDTDLNLNKECLCGKTLYDVSHDTSILTIANTCKKCLDAFEVNPERYGYKITKKTHTHITIERVDYNQ